MSILAGLHRGDSGNLGCCETFDWMSVSATFSIEGTSMKDSLDVPLGPKTRTSIVTIIIVHC